MVSSSLFFQQEKKQQDLWSICGDVLQSVMMNCFLFMYRLRLLCFISNSLNGSLLWPMLIYQWHKKKILNK
ncbi:hypothetical protein DERF_014958 [Dermatophagoides farinae]|uniref:Uncharacterized protein n=1 Tax=Dermatophagoides farinae TaxID=6954 RepID=A0A922KU40_DERFA|nr:hypothetical protein DERF_014958 [Dermatophagoides farinae]